jgi:solute:Na+ symporter, SSS family
MIDLLIVLAFVVYSVGAGFAARRSASRDLEEYFLAGRTIRGWRAGISMAATQYAADTPLLVAGLVAVGGLYSIWRLWIYGIAFLLMGILLGRAWRRAGVLTDAELTEVRYSGRGVLLLRGLKAVYYGTIINCVVMALVLVAATRIFEIFLPWHEWLPAAVYAPIEHTVATLGLDFWSGTPRLEPIIATTNSLLSIVAMLAFVALYSATGGLRSVISTDVVQFGLMMLGTFLYALLAVRACGGLGEMLARLHEQYGDARTAQMLSFLPPPGEALMPFLVILSLQWFFQMNSDGTGYLAQRTMACATDRDARNAAIVFTLAQVVLRSLLWLPIVIALLVLYPFDPGAHIDESVIAMREVTFARGMDALLPVGIRGIMLTGMLAALASTLDTHLNWGASYWSNDLYKAIWAQKIQGREPQSHELVIVARLSNLLIVVLALIIMANLGSIQTAWQISLLFGAGIGAVLMLRWLWERINLHAEIAAIAASLVLAPLLLVTVQAEWLQLLLMAAGSSLAVVIAALFGPATDEATLVEFYRRVSPPGFWRRTAAAAGADPTASMRALRAGLVSVAVGAAAIYGLLVGGGMLLVHPDRWISSVALIAGATCCMVIWYLRMHRHSHLHDPGRLSARAQVEPGSSP